MKEEIPYSVKVKEFLGKQKILEEVEEEIGGEPVRIASLQTTDIGSDFVDASGIYTYPFAYMAQPIQKGKVEIIEDIKITGKDKKRTKRICRWCYRSVKKSEGITVENRLMCTPCFSQIGTNCKTCEKPILKRHGIRVRIASARDIYFCREECIPPMWEKCGWCGKYAPEKGITKIKTERGNIYLLCKTCITSYFRTCTACKKIDENTYFLRVGGKYYCKKCAKSLFKLCEWCGSASEKDYPTINIPDKEKSRTCFNCLRGYLIHEYNYRPVPIFHSDYPSRFDNIYMGFELEMESKIEDKRGLALKIFKRFPEYFEDKLYIIHDGSVNNGFEIVSHPMTLQYLRKQIDMRSILSFLQKHASSFKSGNCGTHVHIDKEIKDSQGDIDRSASIKFERKMMLFFYANKDKLFKYSRRGREQLDHYSKFYSREEIEYYLQGRPSGDFSKYAVVNLTNLKTLEIRIFRGSLRYDSFMDCIRLTDMLILFLRIRSYSSLLSEFKNKKRGEDSWKAFLSYVRCRSINLYNNLSKL